MQSPRPNINPRISHSDVCKPNVVYKAMANAAEMKPPVISRRGPTRA